MNLAESLGFVPQKTARAVRAINVASSSRTRRTFTISVVWMS